MAIFHPVTLPPPPPEPYPYPAPDAYKEPFSNPSASPTPLLHTPMPMLYPEPTQSPLYAYPMTTPAVPLPLAPAPLKGQVVIPLYTPHNGQLWFHPLLRHTSAFLYITGRRHSGRRVPCWPRFRLDCPFPALPITCSALSHIDNNNSSTRRLSQSRRSAMVPLQHEYHTTSVSLHAPDPSRHPLRLHSCTRPHPPKSRWRYYRQSRCPRRNLSARRLTQIRSHRASGGRAHGRGA